MIYIHLRKFSYLKFLGALTLFVEQVKDGWEHIDEIKRYAESLPIKEVKRRIDYF